MKPMTEAVLKAGIITPNTLREMKRFSPTLDPDAETEEPKELELAAQIIADALEGADYALVKETDLDALRQYISDVKHGTLHVEIEVSSEETSKTDIDVDYGVTPVGEYIIAWTSESIADAMTSRCTYLRTQEHNKHVHFKDVRELYFGDHKAFMVCAPYVIDAPKAV